VAGASALASQSWAAPSPSTAFANYEAKQTTAPTWTWGASKLVCDTAKWADADACAGFTTWGANTPTPATAAADGSYRFFLWLADAGASAAEVLRIEDGETVNVLAIESTVVSFVTGATGAATCSAASTAYAV